MNKKYEHNTPNKQSTTLKNPNINKIPKTTPYQPIDIIGNNLDASNLNCDINKLNLLTLFNVHNFVMASANHVECANLLKIAPSSLTLYFNQLHTDYGTLKFLDAQQASVIYGSDYHTKFKLIQNQYNISSNSSNQFLPSSRFLPIASPSTYLSPTVANTISSQHKEQTILNQPPYGFFANNHAIEKQKSIRHRTKVHTSVHQDINTVSQKESSKKERSKNTLTHKYSLKDLHEIILKSHDLHHAVKLAEISAESTLIMNLARRETSYEQLKSLTPEGAKKLFPKYEMSGKKIDERYLLSRLSLSQIHEIILKHNTCKNKTYAYLGCSPCSNAVNEHLRKFNTSYEELNTLNEQQAQTKFGPFCYKLTDKSSSQKQISSAVIYPSENRDTMLLQNPKNILKRTYETPIIDADYRKKPKQNNTTAVIKNTIYFQPLNISNEIITPIPQQVSLKQYTLAQLHQVILAAANETKKLASQLLNNVDIQTMEKDLYERQTNFEALLTLTPEEASKKFPHYHRNQIQYPINLGIASGHQGNLADDFATTTTSEEDETCNILLSLKRNK